MGIKNMYKFQRKPSVCVAVHISTSNTISSLRECAKPMLQDASLAL